MPLSRMAVKVLPFDLTKVCPRLTTGCPSASIDVKASIDGVDDRFGMTFSSIMVVIVLWLAVVTSATPIIVEPAAFVVVMSFAVSKSSVIEDPRVSSPTEPT